MDTVVTPVDQTSDIDGIISDIDELCLLILNSTISHDAKMQALKDIENCKMKVMADYSFKMSQQ